MTTEFFAYENMTWPEIQALPRETALVLPLGENYSKDKIASLIGNPEQAGLLPAFPFGWPGSGLVLPENILVPILENLLAGLSEEGFTNNFILAPENLKHSQSKHWIYVDTLKDNKDAASMPAGDQLGKVVIIPIGHTEQHGLHLPMSTDTLIIQAIGQGTANADPDECVCLPVMPYGVSTHRASFAGTLNCGGRAFEDFWLAVIDTLVGRGFDRFYLMSGHGGNSSFLVNIVKYAGERYTNIFCATSWLYLSGPEGIKALEEYRESPVGGMGHACELETSLIQTIRPDLVHIERAVDEMDFVTTPSYYMDWIEGGALVANPPWDDDTRTGAYGAGSLGTPEKGRVWLEAAIREKVTHISEIHEQLNRRIERRKSGFGLWGNAKKSRDEIL